MEDWVLVRAKCSCFEVLSQLRTGVEKDITNRLSLLTVHDQMNFKFREEPQSLEDAFTVLRLGPKIQASLQFSCAEGVIRVRDGANNIRLEGALTLNDQGQCRLKVKEQGHEIELEQWQFRKRALADFFML